jgi:hypothetical protein
VIWPGWAWSGRPAEQHIHSFLELLPFMAIAYLAAVFGGMAGLVGLPYAEEAWRRARGLCPRAAVGGRAVAAVKPLAHSGCRRVQAAGVKLGPDDLPAE